MKSIFATALFLLTLFTGSLKAQQATPNRIALVIGAQNYSQLPPLHNSLNDAKAMTAKLRSKGFLVEALYDPKSKREIRDAINRYYDIMRDKVGAVGLIFYAGHGMQYEGDNYIIPTTATVQSPGDLEDQCVKMNTVMAVLKSANKSLNILLLDACRSLPSFTRDTDQGLTRMEAPQGSIIVFAAQAGKTASDGTGINGLFTSKLLMVLDEPNLNITDVFKKVKQQVYAASGEKQLPSVEDNSIGGDFYFTGGAKIASAPTNSTLTSSVETKPEPAAERKTVAAFDYGYGSSDAPVVTVGSQAWLGKNLNVDHFANGESIPEARTAEKWKSASDNGRPAWCYYNNHASNGSTYGRLYNWYAVHDPRGLAPKGWHVPSDSEWSSITSYLGGETTAGTALKSISGWVNFNGVSGNGNNSSGIAGLPGGGRGNDGTFSFVGEHGDWWSSSEGATEEAWGRFLYFSSGVVGSGSVYKGCGLSVRCVRD